MSSSDLILSRQADVAIGNEFMEMEPHEENFEQHFRDAGLNERWTGRHVLKIVVHAPHGPHAGRRIWPPVC